MEPEERPPTISMRRWTRRADDRWIAGVAGGLADSLELPPWVMRGLFLAATLLGGVGVLIYGLLWWLLPRRDLATSAAERTAERLRGAPTWVGIALLAFGVMLFAGELGWWRPSLVLAFLLIGVGVALFRRDESLAVEPSTTNQGTTVTAIDAPSAGTGDASFRTEPLGTGPVGTALPPAPRTIRRPREHSFLGPLTFGIAMLVVGGAALLDMAGVFSLTIGGAFSAFLLILGVGLVIGTWIGRARWLLVPAVLIAPVALLTTVITIDLDQGFGDRTYAPLVATAFPAEYQLAGGTLTVDLTEIPPSVTSPDVTASLGAGELVLYLPEGAGLTIDGDIGIGTLRVIRVRDLGASGSIGRATSQTGGVDVVVAEQIEPTLGSPMITAHVHVSVGQLTIYRMVERGANP